MARVRSATTSIHTEGNNTNIAHNNREEEEIKKEKNKHIDQDRIKDNVELLIKPIRELYDEEFGDALGKYNAKQRRKDRRIPDYYDHIKNSKKTHEQREMIIQVGSLEDIDSGELTPEEMRDILIEYFEGFLERNPNLKVYNAVIHMDESTPHLHLNFVPVAEGYKQGLEKQVSFDRALQQQDSSYSKVKPFADWREAEDEVLESLLNARGIEKREAKSYYPMSTDYYKELKDRERVLDLRDKVYSMNVKMFDKERESFENEKESFKEEVEKVKEDFKIVESNIKAMIENVHIPEVADKLDKMKDKPRFRLRDVNNLLLSEDDIKDLGGEDQQL